MSMITGCPACGTMFRVVPDQLKISDGWVRCGQCSEVFDATGNLQPDARPVVSAFPQAPQGDPDEPAQIPAAPAADLPRDDSVLRPAPIQAAGALDEDDDFRTEAQANTPATPAIAMPLVAADPVAPVDSAPTWEQQNGPDSRFDRLQDNRGSHEDEDATDEVSGSPSSELDEVSFVRQARSKALWRRPLVRLLLLLAVLALGALLALQFAVHERDRLAASQPQLRPLLEQVCERVACTIGAPRRIESIVIDNSGFTRLRPDVYRLSFTLKNPSPTPVALPALQLTLTDTQEQAVIQRVLMPRDLGAASASLAATAEWTASVALAVSAGDGTAGRIAGYRLLAFYP